MLAHRTNPELFRRFFYFVGYFLCFLLPSPSPCRCLSFFSFTFYFIYLCSTTAVGKMSVCMYVARPLLSLPLSLPPSWACVGQGASQATTYKADQQEEERRSPKTQTKMKKSL